jgi:hypothetical protein
MQWWQYPSSTDRLTELRHQRMLLRSLADDVALAARRLVPAESPVEWRSEAQRTYLERRWELAALLAGAEQSIEETISAVLARIDAVKAQLAAETAPVGTRATSGGWPE